MQGHDGMRLASVPYGIGNFEKANLVEARRVIRSDASAIDCQYQSEITLLKRQHVYNGSARECSLPFIDA